MKGIIGANPDNQFNISGVSYGASLSSYRVFGCSGSVSDDSKSKSHITTIDMLTSVHSHHRSFVAWGSRRPGHPHLVLGWYGRLDRKL